MILYRWYVWVAAGAFLLAGYLPARAYIDGAAEPFADQPIFAFAIFGMILGAAGWLAFRVYMGFRASAGERDEDYEDLDEELDTPAAMQEWARAQQHLPFYWGIHDWAGSKHRGLCMTMYSQQIRITETVMQKPVLVHYALVILSLGLGALAGWGAMAASHSDTGVHWSLIPILSAALGGVGWLVGWAIKAMFCYNAAWADLMLLQYEIVMGGVRQVIGYTRTKVPRLAFANEPSPFWGSHHNSGFAHGYLVMGTVLTHEEIMDQGMDILWSDQVEIFHMSDFVEGKIRANADETDYFEAEREGFHYANTKWMQALSAKAERRGELKRQRLSKPRNRVPQMIGYGAVIFVFIGCSMWQACTGYQTPQDQYDTLIESFSSADSE